MSDTKYTCVGAIGTILVVGVLLMWCSPVAVAGCANSSTCSDGCHGQTSDCDGYAAKCKSATETCRDCVCKDVDQSGSIFCNCASR